MRIFCGLLLFLAFTAPTAAKDKAPAKAILFPQQESDLKPDPAARFGKLENGVRYVVLSNREPRRGRRLLLLADILQDRLRIKVREELGATYSAQTQNDSSQNFPGYGYLSAHIDVEPSMAGKISELAIDIADELSRKGVTDDEFNRAREPMLSYLRQSLRENNYWLNNVLRRAQENPERLEWARTRKADIEAMAPAEISALATKYLGRERASRATILPAPKEK